MVRNYAQLLRLDPEPFVERMSVGLEKAPDASHKSARHRERVPSSAPGRRSTLLYAGFSAVLLAMVGAMAYQWQREKAAPQSVAAAPPVSEAPPAIEQKPMAPPALAQAEAPAQPEVAAEPASPPGTHRLVLRMAEEAWLEVRDAGGASLVSSLNPAGSERAVRGRPPFQLVIGNASRVELSYDGKPVDLKPYIRGEVARLTLK